MADRAAVEALLAAVADELYDRQTFVQAAKAFRFDVDAAEQAIQAAATPVDGKGTGKGATTRGKKVDRLDAEHRTRLIERAITFRREIQLEIDQPEHPANDCLWPEAHAAGTGAPSAKE